MNDAVAGPVTGWAPTAALGRALVLAATGLGVAVLLGEPVAAVLVAPYAVHAVLALLARPAREPAVTAELDHRSLHEGQGTTSRLRLAGAADAEQVTRVAGRAPYVATHPADGRLCRMLGSAEVALEVSPRRWGRRLLGEERVALTSGWGGFRWGPVDLPGEELRVLPSTPFYDSRAESPQPRGLVGPHRSGRPGTGAEFEGIRAFVPGDRLRRINWRVSLRTDRLHVTTARAEQDAALLLLVDALADHGSSGGVGGPASSLDLSVRAATAVAEHTVREGDRVGLRVVGLDGFHAPYGTGRPHLRRLLWLLSGVQPGPMRHGTADRLRLPVSPGTVVVVFSPMFDDSIATIAVTMVRRGLTTLVVDTLPARAEPALGDGVDPALARLAWRMRLIEREQVLAALAALGCPVVPWRGPGTIDAVLRRLARRGEQPRMTAR